MSPIQKAQEVANAQSVLGVGPNSTEAELRKAWKKLAFDMHPDRGVGSSEDLANINAAYSLLRERRVLSRQVNGEVTPDAPQAAPAANSGIRPKRPTSVRPRPSLETKTTDIMPAVLKACREALKDDATPAHVPVRIERKGRQVTYMVENTLVEGLNRVVLPASPVMVGREAPQVLTFRASTAGKGTLNVPEGIVKKMFPGTASVKIAFARA